MRAVRYAAAAVTVLMALMNLPFAFARPDDVARPVAWLVTLVGVAGIVAAVALLRRTGWAAPAVTVIGALNVVGALVALATRQEGAVIGLVVSALGTVLGLACLRMRTAPATRPV